MEPWEMRSRSMEARESFGATARFEAVSGTR